MGKLLLIAKTEYVKRAGKRSFIVGTLAIPLLFVVIMGVTVFIIGRNQDQRPFGYVDPGGALAAARMPEGEKIIPMIAFPDEVAARAALAAGDIQGYHVLPEDYPANLEVHLYYWDERPDSEVLVDFDHFVRANLLAGEPNDLQTRIIEGPRVVVQSTDGRREFRFSRFGYFR